MPIAITPQHTPTEPVILRLHGLVSSEDVDHAIDAVEAAIASGPAIGLVVDMSDLDDASVGALARDARFELSMLGRLDRFARLAIVGAPAWINAMAGVAGGVIPGVRVRSFDQGEIALATSWAKERTSDEATTTEIVSDRADGPGIMRLPSPREDLIAFSIDGAMEADAVAPIVDDMLARFERGETIDLFGRIDRIGSIDWGMVSDERFRRMKIGALTHVRRYAIVGAPDWMEAAAKLAARVASVDIRTFDRDEENEAWAWLDEDRRIAA